MGKANGNAGKEGDESVRIGGRPIADLGIRDQVETAEQLEARKRKAEMKAILSKFPPYSTPGLEAQLKQCEGNLDAMRGVCIAEETKIAEYRVWIRLCQQRDKELRSAGFEPRK